MELLRIVSMFLIVLHHSTIHGMNMEECLASDLFWFAGGAGVDCFVLISGYYMIQSRITLAKMLKLWVTVLTYSLGYFLVVSLWLQPGEAVSVTDLVQAFLPIRMRVYWFVTVYVVLMLFSPFLNHYIHSLTKEALQRFMLALVLLVAILPTGCRWWGGELAWFIMLYTLAAYLRLHGGALLSVPARRWFAAAAAFLCLIAGSVCLKWLVECPSLLVRLMGRFVYGKESLSTFALALCLFIGFASCRIGAVRWVNSLSACAFGVYLVHEHPQVRPFLWNGIFGVEAMAESAWLLPYCLGASLVVYAACTFIEMLRIQTLGRLYDWAAPRWILPLAYGVWGRARGLFGKMAQRL